MRSSLVGAALLSLIAAPSSGCQKDPSPQPDETPKPAATAQAAPRPSASIRRAPPGVEFLTAMEVMTENAPPDDALPMIVALHDENNTAEGFGSLYAHQEFRARLLAFRAPLPSGTTTKWFPSLADVGGDLDKYSKGIKDVTERLAATLVQARKKKPTWGKPIVIGFSQGATVALLLSLTHPELVSHSFIIAGDFPPPLMPAKRDVDKNYPDIFFEHARQDQVFPFEAQSKVFETLKGMGFPAKFQPVIGPHDYTFAIRRETHDDLQDALKQVAAGDRFPP